MDSKERATLSLDIMHELLSYIPIGRMHVVLALFSPYITMEERKYEIDRILDINRYLSQLTEYPSVLLHIMRQTDTLLSGLWASNYFVPGSLSSSSNWNFYCSECLDQLYGFRKLTELIGFKWERCTLPYTDNDDLDKCVEYICKITYKGVSHSIQLVSTGTISPYYSIIRFDLTFYQCIISGFFAVSLYHKYTMNKRSYKFIYTSPDIYDSLENRDNRAYTILKPLEKNLFHELNTYRNISDKQTSVVFFDKYTDISMWHTPKNHICKMLPMIRWYNTDTPGYCKEICFTANTRSIDCIHDDTFVTFQSCSPTLHHIYGSSNTLLYSTVNYRFSLRLLTLRLMQSTYNQIIPIIGTTHNLAHFPI